VDRRHDLMMISSVRPKIRLKATRKAAELIMRDWHVCTGCEVAWCGGPDCWNCGRATAFSSRTAYNHHPSVTALILAALTVERRRIATLRRAATATRGDIPGRTCS
jgi:hypothetical protein